MSPAQNSVSHSYSLPPFIIPNRYLKINIFKTKCYLSAQNLTFLQYLSDITTHTVSKVRDMVSFLILLCSIHSSLSIKPFTSPAYSIS